MITNSSPQIKAQIFNKEKSINNNIFLKSEIN